ncbi:MAG: DUF4381 domain-containing protein [Halieaceae bacterium]
MPLPALPDVFGNYAIQGIEEVLAPATISWLPTTIAWKLLSLLALAGLLRWSWRRWQRWQRNRYRATALRQLHQLLQQDAAPLQQTQQLSRLLKAVALQAHPRSEVAALHGDSWWAWLQASTDMPVFSDSSKPILVQEQYRDIDSISPQALQQFTADSTRWIQLHRDPRSV